MLLYEEMKVLERTMGEEAAGVLAKLFERREAVDRAELATKEDLRALELRITAEIEKSRAETEQTKAQLQADISQLRIDTARDLRELEMRMVIKLGGMLAACVAATAALLKIMS